MFDARGRSADDHTIRRNSMICERFQHPGLQGRRFKSVMLQQYAGLRYRMEDARPQRNDIISDLGPAIEGPEGNIAVRQNGWI